MTIERVETEALKLKPKARAELAEKLLKSLEDLSEEEIQLLWAEEAVRRNAELDFESEREGLGLRFLSAVQEAVSHVQLCLKVRRPLG